jgi:hypothetical protein
LTPNKNASQNNAKIESGTLICPIWLFINPKYPSVLRKIWTPVLFEIQEKVYRDLHKSIDISEIYTRYVVKDKKLVPNTLNWWDNEVIKEMEYIRGLISEYRPKLLISFGSFPFEYLRRVCKITPKKGPKYWSNKNISDEFIMAIENFDISKTNLIPLLRNVNFNGKFIEDIGNNKENYFHIVGTKIAEKLIENKDSLNIWIS